MSTDIPAPRHRSATSRKGVLNPDPYKGRNLLVPPGTDITKYRKSHVTVGPQLWSTYVLPGTNEEQGKEWKELQIGEREEESSKWDLLIENNCIGEGGEPVLGTDDPQSKFCSEGFLGQGQSSPGPSLYKNMTDKNKFDDATDLFNPPDNLYEISEGIIKWNWTAREKTLRLKNDHPELLKASLKHWILAAMSQ